jgi:hypothetical protein
MTLSPSHHDAVTNEDILGEIEWYAGMVNHGGMIDYKLYAQITPSSRCENDKAKPRPCGPVQPAGLATARRWRIGPCARVAERAIAGHAEKEGTLAVVFVERANTAIPGP